MIFILIWIVTVMSMFKIFGHNICHSQISTVSSSFTDIFQMAFPHLAIIFYLCIWTSFKYYLLSHTLFIYGFKNLKLYSLSLATYAVTVILFGHTNFPIIVPPYKKRLVHNVMWKA